MFVSSYREGEATFYAGIGILRVWVFQCATRKHRFLRTIKGNSTKLLPIIDKLVFSHNFVNSKFALSTIMLEPIP